MFECADTPWAIQVGTEDEQLSFPFRFPLDRGVYVFLRLVFMRACACVALYMLMALGKFRFVTSHLRRMRKKESRRSRMKRRGSEDGNAWNRSLGRSANRRGPFLVPTSSQQSFSSPVFYLGEKQQPKENKERRNVDPLAWLRRRLSRAFVAVVAVTGFVLGPSDVAFEGCPPYGGVANTANGSAGPASHLALIMPLLRCQNDNIRAISRAWRFADVTTCQSSRTRPSIAIWCCYTRCRVVAAGVALGVAKCNVLLNAVKTSSSVV